MADALDSKSNVGDYVWVQVPPPAPMWSVSIFLIDHYFYLPVV